MTTINLNNRELATVLAALRYAQRTGVFAGSGPLPEDVIFDDGGSLDNVEIDDLCERLNCGTSESVNTEMLEALEALFNETTRDGGFNDWDEQYDEPASLLVGVNLSTARKARAAIKRAKGE